GFERALEFADGVHQVHSRSSGCMLRTGTRRGGTGGRHGRRRWLGGSGSAAAIRQRGLVGGEDFDPAVDPLVGNDQGIGAKRKAHLPHGLAVRGTEETTDVHAGLPPTTAVTRMIRSSGTSALERTAMCGR